MCKTEKKILVIAPETRTSRAKGDYESQVKAQINHLHGGHGIKVSIVFLHCKKFNPQKPLFVQKASGADLIVSGIGPIKCTGIKAPVMMLP